MVSSKSGYNTQISTEELFITHYSIHQTITGTTTLEQHLDGFESHYDQQSEKVIADAGYVSEENYELMEKKGIESYVKYNYFHLEQKRKHRNDPFALQNLHYNPQEEYFLYPIGQKLIYAGQAKRISTNGYVSKVNYYTVQRCKGCPMRGQCNKAKGNRQIEVNHILNQLKAEVRERLLSEKGLYHRSKRPVEVEAVFGQMKSNNRFNRFTMKGLEKVDIEFALMAIAHNLRKWEIKVSQRPLFDRFFVNTDLRLIIRNFISSKNHSYQIPRLYEKYSTK